MTADKEFGASVGRGADGKPKGFRLVKVPKPTGEGTKVIAILPDFFRGTGLHFTMHPQELHLKTVDPPATAPIDVNEFARAALGGGFPWLDTILGTFIRPPTSGHPAYLAIVHHPGEKLQQVTSKRTDVDVAALVDDMEFYELSDTANLREAFATLRVDGTLRQGDLVQVRVPETEEMSFFVAQTDEEMKSSPSACVRALSDYGGYFLTMGPPKMGPNDVPELPPGFEKFQPALEKMVKALDTSEVEARFVAEAKAIAEAMSPALEETLKKVKEAKRIDQKGDDTKEP